MKAMANVNDLRNRNLSKVREAFFSQELCSISSLEKETGLSHGAVINAVRTLEEEGEILLCRKSGTSVGRKTHLYMLNGDYAKSGMVFVGRNEAAEKIRYLSLICDLCGKMSEETVHESDSYDLKDLEKVLDLLISKHPEIRTVLISSPGVCNEGKIRNLPFFEIDAGAIMDEKYHLDWIVENDVNTASIGFHSLYPEYDDLAFVYQARADVFGCGMMIGGRLYNGFAHAAGELRYFPFMKYAREKNAKELLKEQVLSVAALMNPQLIGYYSVPVDSEITIEGELPENVLPRIMKTDDLLSLQKKGLYALAKKRFIEQRGGVL